VFISNQPPLSADGESESTVPAAPSSGATNMAGANRLAALLPRFLHYLAPLS